jgi:hypothetical protein
MARNPGFLQRESRFGIGMTNTKLQRVTSFIQGRSLVGGVERMVFKSFFSGGFERRIICSFFRRLGAEDHLFCSLTGGYQRRVLLIELFFGGRLSGGLSVPFIREVTSTVYAADVQLSHWHGKRSVCILSTPQ